MTRRLMSVVAALSLTLALTACGAPPRGAAPAQPDGGVAPAYKDTTPDAHEAAGQPADGQAGTSTSDQAPVADPNTPVSPAPGQSGDGSQQAGGGSQSGGSNGSQAGGSNGSQSGSSSAAETGSSAEAQSGSTAADPKPQPQGPVQFSTLEKGAYSGLTDRTAVLITSPSDWGSFWQSLHGNVVPAPAMPEVDFSKESVVVVGLGERNTGGYGVEITDVSVQDGKLVVKVKTRQPGPGAMVTMALTQPYHMVKVPVAGAHLSLEVHGLESGSDSGGAGM